MKANLRQITFRAVIKFWDTCYFEVHTHNKPVALLVNYTNERPRSPVTLRSHKAYLVVPGVTGYGH